MKPFPHQYSVVAAGTATGDLVTNANGLQALHVEPPPEFGGPGDLWSPESLLTAAVANCFVLTFRSVARASHVNWTIIECDVVGTLDRIDGGVRFTDFAINARLKVPHDADTAPALQALGKAHRHCLVANSLKASVDLRSEIYSCDHLGSASAA